MDWLRIHVSNLCNFKCPNCHVFELGENNLPNRVMSQETFNMAVDQYLNVMSLSGHKETMISIYGGETLANKKVVKDGILRYGNNCNDIKINWVVNTNGSLLKEEDILFFKENNVQLHISVDGREEIHNISRPTHKGKGTYHLVVPALELVKKHQAPTQINSYMMPSNYQHLNDIVDIAVEYGIKEIYLDQFYNVDMISHEVGMELYRQLFYYGISKGVSILGPWGKVVGQYNSMERKRDSLGKKFQVDVNMDGTFYFPFFSESKKIHREVKDLTTHFKQGAWNEILEQARSYFDKKCDGCSLKDHCFGTAISQVHYHIGTDADASVSCNFFREWCNYLLRPVHFKSLEKLEVISMLELTQIEKMVLNIEETTKSLEKSLWPLKEKISVNILANIEELKSASAQFNLPSWAKATTSGRNLFFHLGTKLTPALVHELTHLFVAQRNLKIPAWFVEGFCEWTQDQAINREFLKHSLIHKNIFEYLKKPENAQKHIIEFDTNLPFENSQYVQAKAFVGYLESTLGKDKLKRLLDFCEDDQLEDALLKLTSKSLEEHIQMFQTYALAA